MEPREWLRSDEERRLSPEYQRELIAAAPREGAIRERGEIMATIANPDRLQRLREETLEYLSAAFGHVEDGQPGTTNYPWLNSPGTDVDGFVLVWRDGKGVTGGGAFVTGGAPLRIPDELREVARAYQSQGETPEERAQLLEWWRSRHHQLERGEIDGIAVRESLPSDTRRKIVSGLQCELARHRVNRRLCFAHGPERGVSFKREDAFPLSSEGARSLNRQRADVKLTTAIAAAAVRNPDALVGLVRMPDTDRLLTEAEILRGVLDVARGGAEQFHIEALAVKDGVRPLARDPEAYERRFGFVPDPLPGVAYLVRALDGRGSGVHFEDPLGNRLEEQNEQVGRAGDGWRSDPARWDDRWRPGATGPEVATDERGAGGGGEGDEERAGVAAPGAQAKAVNVAPNPGTPATLKVAEPLRR